MQGLVSLECARTGEPGVCKDSAQSMGDVSWELMGNENVETGNDICDRMRLFVWDFNGRRRKIGSMFIFICICLRASEERTMARMGMSLPCCYY